MNKAKLIPELKVFDFKSSLDFYTRLIGFKIIYDRPEEDFAMLGLDEGQIMKYFKDFRKNKRCEAAQHGSGRSQI